MNTMKCRRYCLGWERRVDKIDAETIATYLEGRSGKRTSICIPDQKANEIADFIRRQEKEKEAKIGRATSKAKPSQ